MAASVWEILMAASDLENVFRGIILIRKHFIAHRHQQMIPAVTCGRTMHILLKLPVKAGQTAIACPLCNDVDRLLIQVDQMAGLLDAIMLDILQGTDTHHPLEYSAEMTLTDTAMGR